MQSKKRASSAVPQQQKEDSFKYLDPDEDHIGNNDQMGELIERQNIHKVRFLAFENNQLKKLLADADKNIQLNKNMINMLIQHQENQHGVGRDMNKSVGSKRNTNQNDSMVGSGGKSLTHMIQKLNDENADLHQQLKE